MPPSSLLMADDISIHEATSHSLVQLWTFRSYCDPQIQMNVTRIFLKQILY